MPSFSIRKRLVACDRVFELDVSASFAEGGFLGVRGPSGSGKTTLLRSIAGLCKPEEGFVRVGDETWYDSRERIFAPPRCRSVGFVFQDYALFPHLTVFGNVQYATDDRRRTEELLEMTRLTEWARHFPRELSGGQKQRTALARALGREPRLLLLDEPLSALDEELRSTLGEELSRIRRESGVTAILVSHSRSEIEKLCTDILELPLPSPGRNALAVPALA